MRAALNGYSDPPGYTDPLDGTRFDHLSSATDLPGLIQARTTLLQMRLPNNRLVPIGDTWADREVNAADSAPPARPYLLPAIGRACLGGGTRKDQTQFHLTWSGGYGHHHDDNLSLLLFSHGREMLTDLGYTHTAYRAWAIATAAHNTVVIDGRNQSEGSKEMPSDGRLRWFDAKDARVQVISADGTRAYPGLAKTYRRTLVVVDAGAGRRYAVDLFEVEGGRTHDYFLHGEADSPATVATNLKLAPLGTLLPPAFNWKPTRNEGEAIRAVGEPHYAYGFLRNLQAAPAPSDSAVPVAFRLADGSAPGLRVTLLAEADSRLITGENPSIRLAKEDDGKLEQFKRPFLMLRHKSRSGRSTFVSVLEPYAGAPFLDSIERAPAPDGAVALRVRFGERIDIVVIGAAAPTPVAAGKASATFQGEVGVLILRGDAVEHAYALGEGGWTCGGFKLVSTGARSAPLRAVDGHDLILDRPAAPAPKASDIVRLLTADGWVYPYTVVEAAVDRNVLRLRVAEGPGITFNSAAQRLRLTTFPQREHSGPARVEWDPI